MKFRSISCRIHVGSFFPFVLSIYNQFIFSITQAFQSGRPTYSFCPPVLLSNSLASLKNFHLKHTVSHLVGIAGYGQYNGIWRYRTRRISCRISCRIILYIFDRIIELQLRKHPGGEHGSLKYRGLLVDRSTSQFII